MDGGTAYVTRLEREIRERLNETIEMMLQGAAADYAAYASLVARYRALKQLVEWIDEHKGDDDSDE